MNESLHLAFYAGRAVGTVLLVSAAGAALVRFKVIRDDSLKTLSQIVFSMMLPCLFFAKTSERIDVEALKTYWAIPLSAALFIGFGLGIGWIVAKLCRAPADFFKASISASAFGNSGFIPIPLVAAICIVFPSFGPEKSAQGISYISLYMLLDSVLFFTVAYALIAGRGLRDLKVIEILNPPILGMLVGMLVGAVPSLKALFVGASAPLAPVFDASNILGSAAVPCALIVMGGRLAYGPASGNVRKGLVGGLIAAKLVLMPLFGVLAVWAMMKFGMLPNDALLALVLVIQAAVPPASSISVMCALKNEAVEKDMASLLFWIYAASVPTLTFFIVLTMRIFS